MLLKGALEPVCSQQLCHVDEVSDGDGGVCVWSLIRKVDWMFSIDARMRTSKFLPIRNLGRIFGVYQFRALCFGLSMVLQVFTKAFTLISEWAHQSSMLFCNIGIWLSSCAGT